nr:hypothetical protein Iba_chr05cCG11440 [Ipomoea batatas]
MEFHKPSLRKELDLSVEKDLIKFLTWFYPLKYCKKLCQEGPEFFTVHLHREVTAWVILREIWPREGIQPDVRQDNEIYYEIIKSASNQYYYELSQVQKEDIWSQDPWNFDDIDSVLEEVEKIEKACAQKSEKKRPEHRSQWNKDVWRTKRSYFNYSTESDTALDEDSVTDLQFHGEWMIMKAKQPNWNPQNWK